MSSRFNTFLHGPMNDVAAILDGDCPRPIDDSEIRAILTNACRRIATLESEVSKNTKAIVDTCEHLAQQV